MGDWMKSFNDIAGYAKNVAQQASTMVAGSELEKKLAEATSNEPWGASSTMLGEIARATFAYDDFKTVMLFVWRSSQNQGSLWRVTYKTLNVLDYILRHGSDRVIEDARDHLREIKKLQKFEFVDADGKDQGINIREKARQLIELLNSDEQLNAERDKARATRNKYSGVSAADMSSGGGGAQQRQPEVKKGFSDDDFKYAADRSRQSSQPDAVLGLTSIVGGLVSSATEYATAASKQLQSMQTLFPSNELDSKLNDAMTNSPSMPSTSLLYELGRATHRDDDYRLILAAIWQNVLRSNQRPRVLLKTLMVLESVLVHGPERALEETLDMKTDIKVLQSFSSPDFNEAGKVQAKAHEIIEMLDNNSKLLSRRQETAGAASGNTSKYEGFSSETAPRPKKNGADEAGEHERWNPPDDGFAAAFDAPAPAPAPDQDLFDVGSPAPAAPAADPPAAASSLSANIGSIKVNLNREGKERNRASTGGLSLGKLPTPAVASVAGGFAAPPAPTSSAADSIFDLLDTPSTAPQPAGAPGANGGTVDFFGSLSSGSGAVMALGGGGGDMGGDFGDFGSAAPAPKPPQPPSAESMLQSALTGFSMSGAPSAPAPPTPPTKMGPGSGLGLSGIPQMQAQAPRPPMGGMGAPPMGGMGSPPMGGMGTPPMGGMGGPHMGGMGSGMGGGMGGPGMRGGMGGPSMGGPGMMGGMGGPGMGGAGMMGGMGGPGMGGAGMMGGMGGPSMGGAGMMGGMGMGGGMGGLGMGAGMGGMSPMGGMGGGVPLPSPTPARAPAPDPFADLMK